MDFFFFSIKVTYSIDYPHFCKQHENLFVVVKKALKTHLQGFKLTLKHTVLISHCKLSLCTLNCIIFLQFQSRFVIVLKMRSQYSVRTARPTLYNWSWALFIERTLARHTDPNKNLREARTSSRTDKCTYREFNGKWPCERPVSLEALVGKVLYHVH